MQNWLNFITPGGKTIRVRARVVSVQDLEPGVSVVQAIDLGTSKIVRIRVQGTSEEVVQHIEDQESGTLGQVIPMVRPAPEEDPEEDPQPA